VTRLAPPIVHAACGVCHLYMMSRHAHNLRCACMQLYVGERPWAGLRPVQIILKKTTGRANLAFPPGTPAAYKVPQITILLICFESWDIG